MSVNCCRPTLCALAAWPSLAIRVIVTTPFRSGAGVYESVRVSPVPEIAIEAGTNTLVRTSTPTRPEKATQAVSVSFSARTELVV